MIEPIILAAAVTVVPARPAPVPARPAPVRPAAPAPAKPAHVDAPHPATPVYTPVIIPSHGGCNKDKDKDCKKGPP